MTQERVILSCPAGDEEFWNDVGPSSQATPETVSVGTGKFVRVPLFVTEHLDEVSWLKWKVFYMWVEDYCLLVSCPQMRFDPSSELTIM